MLKQRNPISSPKPWGEVQVGSPTGLPLPAKRVLVISVEDVLAGFLVEEDFQNEAGETLKRKCMDMERVGERIVKTMLAREEEGKHYGVIVVAEGLGRVLAVQLRRRSSTRRSRTHQHFPSQPVLDSLQGDRR
jgi:hypothetical protein